jgi:hypothetical protein
MIQLDERLRQYAAARAERISQNDSDLLVARALARPARRGQLTRHGRNVAGAVLAILLLVAGGVVLETKFHRPTAPGAGPLPTVPNEIVNLDRPSGGTDIVTPFRLKDRTLLDPRARWIVAPGTAVMITSGGLCDLTVIHVVDLGSPPHDTRQPVSLRDCYSSPTIVPKSTSILLRHVVRNGDPPRFQELGTVAYDWSAGQLVRSYPNVPDGFIGGLVSGDGKLLYTMGIDDQVDITDLTTGASVAHLTVPITHVGLNSGGLSLSADGGSLYVNEGTSIRIFDARTGTAGAVLDFREPRSNATSAWPASAPGRLAAWLMSLLMTSADAKEGFEPGHGIAVDPKGRWVAGLGADDRSHEGIWVFDTSGSIRLLRHIGPHVTWRGIAASLDGSVLYGLETVAQEGAIDVIDPHTGQMRKLVKPQFSDILGIAGVEPNSP